MVTAIPQFENFAIPLIALQNLKSIVILAINFSPLISKFYQLATRDFFGLVIQLNFFLEIGRNYVSVTITIISNITDFCVSVT